MYSLSALSILAMDTLSELLSYTGRSISYLKSIFTFPFAILAKIFSCLFSFLPKRMQRSINFSRRYAGKWAYHKKSSAKIKLRQIPGHLPHGLLKTKGTDRALANAMLYDIVLLIAPKVHYADLVNLSMVSKRVRATMFPAIEEKDQDRGLRL